MLNQWARWWLTLYFCWFIYPVVCNKLDQDYRYIIKVVKPERDGLIFGGNLNLLAHVAVQQASTSMGYTPTNEPLHSNMVYKLSVNDIEVHANLATSLVFQCTLLDSAFKYGRNSICIELLDGNQGGIAVASTHISVLMSNTTSNLISTARLNSKASVSSVLLMGVNLDILPVFAGLTPYRLSIVHAQHEVACNVLVAEINHCIEPNRAFDLIQSIYFDVAFIDYQGLLDIKSMNKPLVMRMLVLIREMTHGSVWLWAHQNERVYSTLLISPLVYRALYREKKLFRRVVPGEGSGSNGNAGGIFDESHHVGSIENLLASRGNDIWVSGLDLDLYNARSGVFADLDASIGGDGQKYDYSTTGEERTNAKEDATGDSVIASSIYSANFAAGRVKVHVRDACLMDDGKTLLVFTAASGDRAEEQRSATGSGRENNQWLDFMRYVAMDESRGFQFTTFNLKEVNLAQNNSLNAILKNLHWYQGVTAWPLTAVDRHIIHQIEPLLQLLLTAVDTHAHRYKYDEIDRIIFPGLDGKHLNDWIVSMISLILQFSHQPVLAAQQSTASRSYVSALPAAVHMRNHIFRAPHPVDKQLMYLMHHLASRNRTRESMKANPMMENLSSAACFKNLILLGRTNTRLKFFPSRDIARQFKRFVHSKMAIGWQQELGAEQIPDSVVASNDSDLFCPPVSLHCTLHVKRLKQDTHMEDSGHSHSMPGSYDASSSRTVPPHQQHAPYRKLKVTIALRTSQRFILNLPELIELMVGTGLVDNDWLFGHLIVLESVPFRRQVEVMAATDLFICIHGAGILNGIFMQAGSAVFELANGRFADLFFAAPLHEAEIGHFYTYSKNHTAETRHCSPNIPLKCIEGSIYDASSIDCASMKSCSVIVNKDDFHVKFMESYYYVLREKWNDDEGE